MSASASSTVTAPRSTAAPAATPVTSSNTETPNSAAKKLRPSEGQAKKSDITNLGTPTPATMSSPASVTVSTPTVIPVNAVDQTYLYASAVTPAMAVRDRQLAKALKTLETKDVKDLQLLVRGQPVELNQPLFAHPQTGYLRKIEGFTIADSKKAELFAKTKKTIGDQRRNEEGSWLIVDANNNFYRMIVDNPDPIVCNGKFNFVLNAYELPPTPTCQHRYIGELTLGADKALGGQGEHRNLYWGSRPVPIAGELIFEEGKLVKMTNQSGSIYQYKINFQSLEEAEHYILGQLALIASFGRLNLDVLLMFYDSLANLENSYFHHSTCSQSQLQLRTQAKLVADATARIAAKFNADLNKTIKIYDFDDDRPRLSAQEKADLMKKQETYDFAKGLMNGLVTAAIAKVDGPEHVFSPPPPTVPEHTKKQPAAIPRAETVAITTPKNIEHVDLKKAAKSQQLLVAEAVGAPRSAQPPESPSPVAVAPTADRKQGSPSMTRSFSLDEFLTEKSKKEKRQQKRPVPLNRDNLAQNTDHSVVRATRPTAMSFLYRARSMGASSATAASAKKERGFAASTTRVGSSNSASSNSSGSKSSKGSPPTLVESPEKQSRAIGTTIAIGTTTRLSRVSSALVNTMTPCDTPGATSRSSAGNAADVTLSQSDIPRTRTLGMSRVENQ